MTLLLLSHFCAFLVFLLFDFDFRNVNQQAYTVHWWKSEKQHTVSSQQTVPDGGTHKARVRDILRVRNGLNIRTAIFPFSNTSEMKSQKTNRRDMVGF
jgi:hypothetical protein